MKLCVVGAEAIGGLLAVRFGSTGHQVAVVDQGVQLEAIRERGLTLRLADGSQEHHRPWFAEAATEPIGPVDLVFLATKAHDIASVAPGLAALYQQSTAVVTVQNGIPWWYFQRHGGAHADRQLAKLDPHGVIRAHVPIDFEPGCIQQVEGSRFCVGEPDGSESERCLVLRDLFRAAGFKSYLLPDVRSELWLKAWGAAAFNPLSALTGATMAELCRYSDARQLVIAMMKEVEAVASGLGVIMGVGIAKSLAGADAVLGSILELAALQGISTPHLASI